MRSFEFTARLCEAFFCKGLRSFLLQGCVKLFIDNKPCDEEEGYRDNDGNYDGNES